GQRSRGGCCTAPTGSGLARSGGSVAAAAYPTQQQQHRATLAGPLYSFIGGWSYQKAVLLG
ncbi:hypothetical protein BOX15_Mlig000687g6, partial [Macrostomum lignano]